jgi:HSP20 family protein
MRIIRYNHPSTRSLPPLFQSPWTGLETEMDKLFENAVSNLLSAQTKGRFAVDLYEDKDNTYVRAELPGVKKEDISIELVDGYLNIQASRKSKTGDSEQSVALSRSVMVPEGTLADKISASHENGVLTILIPKKEEAKPRKISVSIN